MTHSAGVDLVPRHDRRRVLAGVAERMHVAQNEIGQLVAGDDPVPVGVCPAFQGPRDRHAERAAPRPR